MSAILNRSAGWARAALVVGIAWLWLIGGVVEAAVSVTNVRVAQRAGTKLVDVDYDVVGGTGAVTVAMMVSSDGGATWTVPVKTVTGAVGGVTAGLNLRMTWDAGADWNGQYSAQTRVRVVMSDAPAGMVAVVGGTLPASSPLGAVAVGTFSIGKYEVTWGEFQPVRTWAAANGYDIGSVGAGTGTNYPVTNVTWYQAVKWCNARSEKEGKTPVYKVSGVVYRTGNSVPTVDASANGYRLPTEAEWEWAARGGLQSLGYTYSGSNTVGDVAWYSGNNAPTGTKVVGTKAGNEIGLYDMSGNVFEWCFDASGASRVNRGGDWLNTASDCTVVYRNGNTPAISFTSYGFRVASSSVP